MTQLEALKKAQETGQIAITKETANILNAVAMFDKAIDELTTTFADNLPCEISDNETIDGITDKVYELLRPLQDYIFAMVGDITMRRMLIFSFRDKFNGL